MKEVPHQAYQVLLYYCYMEIADPDGYRDEQRALCESLELLGRIIIGNEGINGTVSGTVENCQKYIEALRNAPLTANIEFKIDDEQEHVFPKLSVKSRTEIVTLGLGENDFSPTETTGKYLNPEQWKEAMNDPNAVILDTRNDYEWKLGKFKNAILPPVESFRDLPKWIQENREMFDGKKILAYCTGGIRCEKFTGYLVREGFEDVSQLHGGIVSYGKDPVVRGEDFEGLCYVFDERIGVPVNTKNPSVIARCVLCGGLCESYINCANKHSCNLHFICCEACKEENLGCCSDACKAIVMEERSLNI